MAFLEFYKPGQGTKGRLAALLALFALIGWGCHSLWRELQGSVSLTRPFLQVPRIGLAIDWTLVITVVVLGLGCVGTTWVLNRRRAVNLLVDTEAEMKRVSWPSRREAWNSSIIVVITVLVLMGLLFFYDFALNLVLGLFFARGGA